ncbi:hypothetical protein ZIOFF_073379 [Zingiber officinale]|uniref:Uncharacterized protein n=1 Tax=Zingiber officinale TaxID=94328 RepID=A0A8J5C026_ZINOF|nr:hypothetical protein ZIOFF_073379 [Zingiber officinale]
MKRPSLRVTAIGLSGLGFRETKRHLLRTGRLFLLQESGPDAHRRYLLWSRASHQCATTAASEGKSSPISLDFPDLFLSPITPLVVDPLCPSWILDAVRTSVEQERDIVERGFYLHPSPREAKLRQWCLGRRSVSPGIVARCLFVMKRGTELFRSILGGRKNDLKMILDLESICPLLGNK